jgi:hypothetical protein
VPTFRLDQSKELGEWLQGGFSGGAKRGLLSAAFRALGVIQNEIIPAQEPQPVDTGAYRAAWQVEEHDKGVDLVNTLPYAPVIEYGARGENIKIGRAMIDALARWVIRKGLIGRAKGPNIEAEARSMAWAIAKSMQRRGIFNRDGNKGLRVGEKAVAKIREFLPEEIAREVKRKIG